MTETDRPRSTVLRLASMGVGVRVTRLLLRTAGFARTITLLGRIPPLGPTAIEPDAHWVAEIAHVSRWRYGASCLDRSVFLWFVMRQHRLPSELRIGIASSDDGIDGHAWIEFDGMVINDEQDVASGFAVFGGDPVGIVFA